MRATLPTPGAPQKRRAVAHLLNLLAPGVGLGYWERSARASRVVAGGEVGLMCALAIWIHSPFHLGALICALAALWVPLQLWLAQQVSAAPAAEQRWVRRPEGLWPHLALIVLCWAPPLLTVELCRSRLFSLARVWDSSMFPQLLEGDVLFVDRRAFMERAPRVGELVVVECPSVGPVVSRVIALAPSAGLSVRREEGGEVKVGDALYPREPARPDFTNATPEERQRLLDQRWWVERAPGGGAYLTGQPRFPSVPPQAITTTLEGGELFLLPDVRDMTADYMRCSGRMSAARLIGQPLFVHAHESPSPRPSRLGLVAR